MAIVVIYATFLSNRGVNNVVTALTINAYSGFMANPKKPVAQSKAPREYPNRIRELNKERGWNYDVLAEKVGSHPKTVGALATGKAEMTLTWMQRFARVYGVKAFEIIERPEIVNARRVPVIGRVRAGDWADSHAFNPQAQRVITIPNDDEVSRLDLYALQIEGESMNRLYASGSIVVLSRLSQRPGEIVAGKRYHVVRTRGDLVEDTIKTLVRDGSGEYWLQPESNSPAFSAFPLEGEEGTTVELRGRVRRALIVE